MHDAFNVVLRLIFNFSVIDFPSENFLVFWRFFVRKNLTIKFEKRIKNFF